MMVKTIMTKLTKWMVSIIETYNQMNNTIHELYLYNYADVYYVCFNKDCRPSKSLAASLFIQNKTLYLIIKFYKY